MFIKKLTRKIKNYSLLSTYTTLLIISVDKFEQFFNNYQPE